MLMAKRTNEQKLRIDSYHYQNTNEDKGSLEKEQITKDALKTFGLKRNILWSMILIVSLCLSGKII